MVYVNCGCGRKYSNDEEWINLDFVRTSSNVKKCDLTKRLPFEDSTVDLVFSSNMLEHFSLSQANSFIKECYRILKPDGVLRVVVPDLENVCREYLYILDRLKEGDNVDSEYEYITIEMLDQLTRVYSGGRMAEYWSQNPNMEYVMKRTAKPEGWNNEEFVPYEKRLISRLYGKIRILDYILDGRFINSGEKHKWMYDEYSLRKLLRQGGFSYIFRMSYNESSITNWNYYGLEVSSNGSEYKPNCIYMEAKK